MKKISKFFGVISSFALLIGGIAMVAKQSNKQYVEASASNAQSDIDEFTNNGQFSYAAGTGTTLTVLSSTEAQAVAAGNEGAILKINGQNTEVTLDFSGSYIIASDIVSIDFRLYTADSSSSLTQADFRIRKDGAVVNENSAEVLSQIKFEKPNTVSVPILISRLQAGAGLVNVGSVVDIYTNNSYTNESYISNDTNPDISGCTVLAIMRYEDNGEIDSEYSKSKMTVKGNNTNPKENTKSFSSDVLELLKGSIIDGYDEKETVKMLKNYGVKLSNYERQINLGDLDAQYMLLIEAPQDKVNYIINNMDSIILTIPTSQAPDWMINEISSTYPD